MQQGIDSERFPDEIEIKPAVQANTAALRATDSSRGRDDVQRLQRLFVSQHPCLSIRTVEEDDVLQVLRTMSVEVGVDLWQWTSTVGLRDGLLSDAKIVPDTTAAIADLYKLTTLRQRAVMVLMHVVS